VFPHWVLFYWMVFKRIAAVLLWLLVTLTSAFGFMSSELKIAPSDFFCGTLDHAEQNDIGTRDTCRENGWLNDDTLSGYCVAANKVDYMSSTGRRGGELYDAKKLSQLESYLAIPQLLDQGTLSTTQIYTQVGSGS